MTKPKPLPEIARCACGRPCAIERALQSRYMFSWIAYRVLCPCGWIGPWRKTERAAILAWNRVMGRPVSMAEIAERARIRLNRKAKKAIDKIRRGE